MEHRSFWLITYCVLDSLFTHVKLQFLPLDPEHRYLFIGLGVSSLFRMVVYLTCLADRLGLPFTIQSRRLCLRNSRTLTRPGRYSMNLKRREF